MLISWNTTGKCNLYCKHCYRSSGPNTEISDELGLTEGKKLLEEMKNAGFRIIIFSGGEPLLRDDIFQLTEYAANLGLRPVFGTNGLLLNQENVLRLKQAGAAGVAVSLDSPTPEFHNKFRQKDDAFKRAVEGIRTARSAGLKVQINMTLTRENFSFFGQMTEFAGELAVQALHPFFLVPTGRGRDIEKESLRKKKYFSMINEALEAHKNLSLEIKPTCAPQFMPLAREMGLDLRFTRGCLAGISYCCILPNGDVHICPYLPVKVGNIREKSFVKIWRESKAFLRLRDNSEYEGECGVCEHLDICGGCRARAYYYTGGNYMAADPWCFKGQGETYG
ncbi:MAG: radical SAM protein [Halanaerobiaceae bacterium]